MTSIKKISGEMLLYLYLLQRQDVGRLKNAMIRFGLWHLPEGQEGALMEHRSQTIMGISDFDAYSDNDLYNALTYLHDSDMIGYSESKDSHGSILLNLRVSARGIDMVESIDMGAEEKKHFNVTFNFNITNEITVESLLKAEFGPIFKASLLG
jgi:hypothetical protein